MRPDKLLLVPSKVSLNQILRGSLGSFRPTSWLICELTESVAAILLKQIMDSPIYRAVRKRNHSSMEWTRSETVALAAPTCNTCHGLGLRLGRGDAMQP